MKKFFLGSSSSRGFFSLFDELNPGEDCYIYILKGGPGTGKSTMMKNLAREMEARDIECERICCSSDPQSLDAVIFPTLGACVADGTAPHTMDPRYPGVRGEIINLGECWNGDTLRGLCSEIVELTDKNAACHARCRRFLETAFSLQEDAVKILKEALDKRRLSRYASRTATRLFPKPNGKIGSESHRILDAITPDGRVFLKETAEDLCLRAVIFEEDFACASLAITDELRQYAIGNGLDVISSPCISGAQGTRHLIIPSLSLGFFTSDLLCRAEADGAKTVSVRRFYDSQALASHKVRLNFSKKAVDEMLGEAVAALSNAKAVHDQLERCYIGAMDYSKISEYEKNLFEKLWARDWHGENEEDEE